MRTRITVGFAGIILVTLLLAGSAFVLILREYQIRWEMNRVAVLTIPLSGQVRSLEQRGTSRDEIVEVLEQQAAELELRVVLADARGVVFADSEETLVGRRLELRNALRFELQRRVRQASVDGPDGELVLMVSPAINLPRADSNERAAPPAGATLGELFLGRPSGYVVGLAVPPHSLAATWLELLPRLGVAALGALLLSIALAWPLAASIARPLGRMTRAAEEMAEGRLDQQIPVKGRDEVARLAAAFNRMASELSASQRTLRDLLANVSHDLRTPLTSIQGFSQALIDGTLRSRAETSEAGRVIHQESSRMSRLVDDLLYLSKMESGQVRLAQREIALADLVVRRLEAVSWRAAEAAIELRWQPEAAPLVLGDPAALERVVDNLLDNAIRYTPGGGSVTVRLEAGVGRQGSGDGERAVRWSLDSGPGRGQSPAPDPPRAPTPDSPWGSTGAPRPTPPVLLSVHNTGSEIPAEDLPQIFERFYQVDKARAAGSSGLGLAISREIVQAHGGRCWAESSLEQGTTLFVLLPALAERSVAQTTDDTSAAPEAVIPLVSGSRSEG